ncbi:hypothetical protein LCGC14_1255310 [marine sediment metagenome]|uniref:Head-tail adaptor protein n=1 Tax=marine sediment metagenome TaxID=412755 RepID=A0A0F9L2D1_9ZZZZ
MITNLFNTTVDVIRITRASDSMGGWTETEVVLHNNLKCRINWSKGEEKVQFDKDTWYRDAKLYCSVVNIQTRDRIIHKSKTYEVKNVSNVDEADKYLIVEMRLIE